eukprot:2658620-Pyramimonas_sp.AAC.1
MVQDSARCLKMVPKMFQDAPRPPQDGSKCPLELPSDAPKKPTCFKTLGQINVFGVLALSLPMPTRG